MLDGDLDLRGWRGHTVGEIEKFLGGGYVRGDGHIALLLFGDLEELAREGVGVRLGAGTVGQLRLGRHDYNEGVREIRRWKQKQKSEAELFLPRGKIPGSEVWACDFPIAEVL